jgi:conjugative relaxase-like TrwC/TraI family protein
MTATVASLKNIDYYDNQELKQEATKKGRKDIENYYLESGKSLGFFYGAGSKRLNLFMAPVEVGDVRKYVSGFHPRTEKKLFTPRKPTEKQLENRKKKGPSQEGFDICFSAPKDFTLLKEFDEGNERAYLDIHNKACMRALDKMVSMMYRRVYKDGKSSHAHDVEPVIMYFDHETARPLENRRPDPQIHRHCVVPKKGFTPDGKICTVENFQVFFNQKMLGAIYRAELANGLRELGYEIVPTKEDMEIEDDEGLKFVKVNSFKVLGITNSQREFFSGRNLEINQHAKPGATGLDKYNIAQDIKRVKVDWNERELRSIWKKDAESLALTPQNIRRMKTFRTDKLFETSKVEEEIIRTSLAKGSKLYKGKLMLRLAEYEQYTGIDADTYYQHLKKSGIIIEKSEFELEYTIDIKNAYAKQKGWQSQIKRDYNKCKNEFNEFKKTIHSGIFKPLSPSVKPITQKDLEAQKTVLEKLSNKSQLATNISNILLKLSYTSTLEGIGLQISNLEAKLFDITLSSEELGKIRAEIEKLYQELAEVKKRELNQDIPKPSTPKLE